MLRFVGQNVVSFKLWVMIHLVNTFLDWCEGSYPSRRQRKDMISPHCVVGSLFIKISSVEWLL
jgi:hypothetical protein